MRKLSLLVGLAFAVAVYVPSAKAGTVTYNCTAWNFSFSGGANPGPGGDPGNCVVQSGGNFKDINPLTGTIGTLSTDPEEDGENVSFVFDTGAGTLNVFDADGDFSIPSTITSFSFSNGVLTMNFTVDAGTPFGGDTGVANVFLATPEPATLFLLGTGLLSLAWAGKRTVLG